MRASAAEKPLGPGVHSSDEKAGYMTAATIVAHSWIRVANRRESIYEELIALDARLKKQDGRLRAVFDADPQCKKLAAVEGVGVLTATAFVATIGDPSVFKNGRQVAAWLGLTPREHSSGGKQRQFGITKRGDCYLRKLLIHGARSALRATPRRQDRKSRWVEGISRLVKNSELLASASIRSRQGRCERQTGGFDARS